MGKSSFSSHEIEAIHLVTQEGIQEVLSSYMLPSVVLHEQRDTCFWNLWEARRQKASCKANPKASRKMAMRRQ